MNKPDAKDKLIAQLEKEITTLERKNKELKQENNNLKGDIRAYRDVGSTALDLFEKYRHLAREFENLKADLADAEETLNKLDISRVMKQIYVRGIRAKCNIVGATFYFLDVNTQEVTTYNIANEFVGSAEVIQDTLANSFAMITTGIPSLDDFTGRVRQEYLADISDGDILKMFQDLAWIEKAFPDKVEMVLVDWREKIWGKVNTPEYEHTREEFVDRFDKFVKRTRANQQKREQHLDFLKGTFSPRQILS